MNPLLQQTRRHFFNDCALGLGSLALASLFDDGKARADATPLVNPLAPKRTHHTARAKHVIFLFMAGGPSQLELFDYKPKLTATMRAMKVSRSSTMRTNPRCTSNPLPTSSLRGTSQAYRVRYEYAIELTPDDLRAIDRVASKIVV